MGSEKVITVEGMQKEQAQLRKVFDEARKAFEKSQVAYAKAKAALVGFNNKYGRVLEVLESD